MKQVLYKHTWPGGGEGCLNKPLIGQEYFCKNPTRMCINTNVPVIIIFEHLQLVAKNAPKPVTIQPIHYVGKNVTVAIMFPVQNEFSH